MNKTETVLILRMVKALCPAQSIDEYTPDVWADAMSDTRFVDAQQAVRNMARTELEFGKNFYIQPGHILGEVTALRTKRLRAAEPIEIPRDVAGTPGEPAWRRAESLRIMDGRPALRAVES